MSTKTIASKKRPELIRKLPITARDFLDYSFLCYNGVLQFCVSCWWKVWSKSIKSKCSSLCSSIVFLVVLSLSFIVARQLCLLHEVRAKTHKLLKKSRKNIHLPDTAKKLLIHIFQKQFSRISRHDAIG